MTRLADLALAPSHHRREHAAQTLGWWTAAPPTTNGKVGDTTLAPGVWTHVAAVIRGQNDIDLYVNGVYDSGTYGGIGPASNVVYLGGDAAIGRVSDDLAFDHFAGSIDEVLLYDRELTPTEIEELMDL